MINALATIIHLAILLSIGVSVGAALIARSRRSVPGSGWFILMCLSAAIWATGYLLELNAVDLAAKYFWFRAKFLGGATLATLLVVFLIQYTGRGRLLTPRLWLLLFFKPVLILILVWTNQHHHLFVNDVHINFSFSVPLLAFTPNVGFHFDNIYDLFLTFVVLIFISSHYIRRSANFNQRATIALLGILAVWLAILVSFLDIAYLTDFDLGPLFIWAGISFILLVVYRYRVLELIPIAREVIFEHMDEGILVINPQGIVLDLNPAARKILNRPDKEYAGKPVREIVADWPELSNILLDPNVNHAEVAVGSENSRQFLEIRKSSLLTSLRKPAGYLVEMRDITVQHQLQTDLRRSETIHRLVVENSTDGITIAQDNILRYINPKLASLYGMPVESLVGANFANMLNAWDRNDLYEVYRRRIAAEPVPERIEISIPRPDGTHMDVEVNSSMIEYEGRPAVLVFLHDITERKVMEEKLRQAKNEAEAATLAKSQFLATMSHEIRTPLNAILGMTNLLQSTPLSEDQQDYVEVIQTGGNALFTLINDILDLSKIEANKLELNLRTFHLRQCLEEAVRITMPEAVEKKLEFIFDVKDEVPQYVRGDPDRLRQVIINLIHNAIKFTDQGQVAVSVSVEDPLEGAPYNSKVKITVQDTGTGISPDQMNRLFQSFSQINPSPSRRIGGTGLGLAISDRLANLMGGAISVKSEVGLGSTFTLTIPLERADDEQSSIHDEETNEIDGSFAFRYPNRILVAEDNPVNQKVVLRMLQRLGYQADLVANGSQALAALGRQKHDMIFMDVEMPEIDGLEASRIIRSRETGSDSKTRIIAMTASVSQEDIEQCINAGMDAHLAKPFSMADLTRVICSLSTELDAGRSTDETGLKQMKHIDTERIYDLASSLEDNLTEVIDSYVEETTRQLEEMLTAARQFDSDELQRIVHSLKSSSGIFGAKTMVDLCNQIECSVKCGEQPNIKKIHLIKQEFEKVKQELLAMKVVTGT